MTADVLWFAAGMVLLVGGAEGLVRGAAGLGRAVGVSPLVIGLTVVAFATSSPELAVNLFAAWRQETDIAFGNIVGSNLANIGLVVAVCGLLRPLPIGRRQLERPMLILATLTTLGLGLDDWLGHPPVQFDRAEGLALLVLFATFLYYTVSIARRERPSEASDSLKRVRTAPHLVVTLLSLGLLVVGAELALDGAVDLAHALRVSEELVGLTLVAVGTSLPELVTGLVATRHGESELVVGSILGSNVFNLLMVLGATALIRPVPIPARGLADLLAMALLSVLLLAFGLGRRQRIDRIEAAVLLGLYAAYVGWRAAWA